MKRVGGLLAVALLVSASVATVLPVAPAHSAIVKTQISLAQFKQMFGLSSVKKILNEPGSGFDFWMTKRDKNGKKIDWSNPNRNSVDASKSFLVFKIDTAKVSSEFLELLQIKAIKKGSSSATTLDLDIKGDPGSGVSVVTDGDVSVSPS
jgi:hypothetical protein